jgi:hypothetical protein
MPALSGSITATRRPGVNSPLRNPTQPAAPAQPNRASAHNAVIHILPRLRPPPPATSFRRIHRISFLTSLLHITHTVAPAGAHDLLASRKCQPVIDNRAGDSELGSASKRQRTQALPDEPDGWRLRFRMDGVVRKRPRAVELLPARLTRRIATPLVLPRGRKGKATVQAERAGLTCPGLGELPSSPVCAAVLRRPNRSLEAHPAAEQGILETKKRAPGPVGVEHFRIPDRQRPM